MVFHVTHLNGSMDSGRYDGLPDLLDELLAADGEHADVSVQHESGLSVSVFRGWRLVVEDVEEGTVGPVWREFNDRELVLEVLEEVARGVRCASRWMGVWLRAWVTNGHLADART